MRVDTAKNISMTLLITISTNILINLARINFMLTVHPLSISSSSQEPHIIGISNRPAINGSLYFFIT
jgi:hypothetical protein